MVYLWLSTAILNVIDAICTHAGLQLGFVKEANPLMNSLYETSPYLFLGIKCFLSLSIIFIFIHKKALGTFRFWRGVTIFVTVVYGFILVDHMVWISLYFFTLK